MSQTALANEDEAVDVIEHVTIPLSDGTELAARMWMPSDANTHPVPAILEYIPYRKRDFTRDRDESLHPVFAAHGYIGIRVDLRGSGDSEGVLEDEYLERELQDGIEVINWLAEQPWCDGNVGMIGISWGGFNGLQIAARQPEPLKAVVSVCSTDDRYADDVHYMSGCLLGDNLSWASVMFAFNSLPPDPALVGDKWRDMWFERLEGSGLWLEKWLQHQTRDDYWQHGSICEDYASVKTPVMAVSGWADGYTNSVFRMLDNLDVPTQGLVGPWSHKYPHQGVPGPAIDFQGEAIRWWDRWLKGHDNGIEDEPKLRAWMQESAPPSGSYNYRPGYWAGEMSWPPQREERVYQLEPDLLTQNFDDPVVGNHDVESPLSVGLYAGKWCSYSLGADLPHDQREEDGGALVFDTEILEEDLELLGAPVAELELSCNQPTGIVAVRLSDVAPDGSATRCTYGLLNLTHRNGHDQIEEIEPGKRYRVLVQLNELGQIFSAGHCVRLSVSCSYYPLAWPPAQSTRLTVHTENSRLRLPHRPRQPSDSRIGFDEPRELAPMPIEQLAEGDQRWLVHRDLYNNQSQLEVIKDGGKFRIEDIDLTVAHDTREYYSFKDGDFRSPAAEVVAHRTLERDDWSVYVRTRTVLTADPEYFYIFAEIDAYEDDRRVYSYNWNRSVTRYGV
ncbi:CocE/NonD family hydrolase [Salinisphaera sp. SPP-AMP-43]|uniref:CocE/NonD family hydrolase n=1 Tax=Salinisphaera sp. SPP-AMP-43 TaxID=3121288 RepID=UPI003C6DB8EB